MRLRHILRLRTHREIKEKPEIWIIRGEDTIVTKIRETILGSKKELMVAVTFISTQPIKQILPTFETHNDHKVKIQLITTCDAKNPVQTWYLR